MRCSKAALVLALGSVATFSALGDCAVAQDLTIENARIIVGNGQVIDRGAVVVRDGRIASVAPGAPPAVSGTMIDATGLTVMAGFIDDHRHLVHSRGPGVARFLSEQAPDEMRHLLEAGFTTVQSGGDDNQGILELKRRVASGQIAGPRIISSGQVPTAHLSDEMAVRAAVDKVVKDLGARRLVHSVNINWVTDEEAREIAVTGAMVASSTGFGTPVFGVFNHDNKPAFRDGRPWPAAIQDGQGVGQEAGYMPVNLRTLYDNGVTVCFSTDTVFDGRAALAHELKTLNLVFSPEDLIKIMGPNSAAFLDKQKEIGTVEAGKLADLVVLGGNPLDGYWNFLTAEIVIKGGKVMIDKRGQPGAGQPFAGGF